MEKTFEKEKMQSNIKEINPNQQKKDNYMPPEKTQLEKRNDRNNLKEKKKKHQNIELLLGEYIEKKTNS